MRLQPPLKNQRNFQIHLSGSPVKMPVSEKNRSESVRCPRHRGGSIKYPREGLSIKGPANLTYRHFQKHPGFRLLFFQTAPFSFLKIVLIFFKVYQKHPKGPRLPSCNFPGSRRPEKALRGPKDILDRWVW